jgi:hypothetical protein
MTMTCAQPIARLSLTLTVAYAAAYIQRFKPYSKKDHDLLAFLCESWLFIRIKRIGFHSLEHASTIDHTILSMQINW